MKVLAVLPYYVPEGGGLERYAHETLAYLVRQGHQVVALAATKGQRTLEDHDGVAVRFFAPRLRLGNAPIQPGLARRVRRLIEQEQPDVVIGHAPVPFPAEAAAHAARQAGIPFVLTYHAGRLRGSSPPLDALAAVARVTTQPLLFHRSARIIAVSRFVRDTACRGHQEKTTIIPPGVDVERFRPADGPEMVEHDQILFVGPLDSHYRWKGVDVLVAAFEELRTRGVPARLRLVGSGDRATEFQSWAAARPDVQLDERLPMNLLVEAFQRAGVVVLPSTTDAEAFGMVLAEANACGRPVMGSAVGGIPDFITPGVNGRLVRPGDAEALADGLAGLLSSPEAMDRMGRAGRQTVLLRHTWDTIGQQTEAVLEAVARRASVRAVV